MIVLTTKYIVYVAAELLIVTCQLMSCLQRQVGASLLSHRTSVHDLTMDLCSVSECHARKRAEKLLMPCTPM